MIEELEELYHANKAELLAEYNRQTNVSFYPEALKQEYLTQIENSLNYIISLNLKKMTALDANLKQKNLLQQENKNLIEEFSEIIKLNNNPKKVKKILDIKIKKSYSNHLRRMNEVYPDDRWYIIQIQKNFNRIVQRKRHMCNGVLELVSKIYNLDSIIKQKEEYEYYFKLEDWIDKNSSEGLNKIIPKLFSILDDIQNDLTVQIVSKITSYYPEESIISDAIYLIENYFLNRNNSKVFKEKYDKIRKFIINDCIHIILYCIYQRLIELRDLSRKEEDSKNEESLEELKKTILKHLNNVNDSKEAGLQIAEKISNNIYKFLLEKEKIISSNEIQFKIDQILKSPQNLVQIAFNKSFNASNYMNVLKYVKSINNFCLEICKTETGTAIEQFLSQKFLTIQQNINDFKEFLKQLKTETNSVYSFLDALKTEMQSAELNYFCEMIETARNSLID